MKKITAILIFSLSMAYSFEGASEVEEMTSMPSIPGLENPENNNSFLDKNSTKDLSEGK